MIVATDADPLVVPARTVVPPRSVLLVDGDSDARIILRRLLEHHGYRAIEAVDHDEAMTLAREQNVSLIVSELLVSSGTGMSCLAESVQGDSALAEIPVLIVTTQAFDADERRARRAGAAYIVKPFVATDVMAHVDRLVTRPAS